MPIPSHHRSGWIPAVGPSAATGFWEKVELLPWTLMHPQPPLGELKLKQVQVGNAWLMAGMILHIVEDQSMQMYGNFRDILVDLVTLP